MSSCLSPSEKKISRASILIFLTISTSIIIYYFYLYYWFFDLDNFYILYFASEGDGSVPFFTGGQRVSFSQYNLNIYIFILGLFTEIFEDKKLVFDIFSLLFFWIFIFTLLLTFVSFLKESSSKLVFSLTILIAFLSFAPYEHWYFIEAATPSKVSILLFLISFIVFFSLETPFKSFYLIALTFLACNTHASLTPTFILFFCSYILSISLLFKLRFSIVLPAISIILTAGMYGLIISILNRDMLHPDSFIVGKTWSDLWLYKSTGPVLDVSKRMFSAETYELLICYLVGTFISVFGKFERPLINTQLKTFYTSSFFSWLIFILLLMIPTMPAFLGSLITEVSLLRIINPVTIAVKLLTFILVVLYIAKALPKYSQFLIVPLLTIFIGFSANKIHSYSKEATSGIEGSNFKEIIQEINDCCDNSILVTDPNIGYVIAPFINSKVFAIMINRMKFVIGWDNAYQLSSINKNFLANPRLNRNKINSSKNVTLLIDKSKMKKPEFDNRYENPEITLIVENSRFILYRMN